jgi:hypothetical protein
LQLSSFIVHRSSFIVHHSSFRKVIMSLTLLTPWALLAGLLLAVPVIIHLFKPRRVRRTPFSSLRWLRLSPQKLSRHVQWHQVLLFLLRAAFISLLVLALARPLLTGGDSEPRERFIVLDVSHSMGYRTSDQDAPFDKGREVAAELIRRHRPGDRTGFLLTGSQTRLLCALSSEPEKRLSALAEIKPGLSETDLCSALPAIRGMLARSRAGAKVELWFVTDNQQHAWRQGAPAGFLDGLSVPVSVRVVDVSVGAPQNAWITRARLLELGSPARRILRVELGCVGDSAQDRKVHVDAIGGMPARMRDVTLSPGRPAVLDFQVPPSAKLESGTLRVHLEPTDGLPADDEFLLNLDNQSALRVVVVEGPAGSVEADTAGLHLKTAIQALSDAAGQPIKLTPLSAVEAREQDFREADVIFLADVPELSDEALSALEERVRGGAGLAVILGGAGKPAFLNERLYRPLDPTSGILPSPVKPTEAADGRLAELTSVQWSHSLLTGLNDPLVGDLAQVRFSRWFEFTGSLEGRGTVLARIDDGAPAILERGLGLGRVVILNTGGGDRWSNLARRKSFVPFVDRLLNHLGSGSLRRSYAVGEVVALPLDGWKPGEVVSVQSPGGRRLAPVIRPAGVARGVLTFEAEEAGIYRVERPGAGFPVVVQAGRGDSVLEPMDSATLKRWWEPADCEVIRAGNLERVSSLGGGLGLWPWLLLLAGVVLLAEFYLVHRVCPRASPKLAHNLVALKR